ncbi:MAG: sulfatase-like hydrolase/transferase [Anaerolineales bacterium]
MKNQINRRDFLKLAGMLPLSVAAPRLVKAFNNASQQGQAKNVIIVVFDAWSAFNVSLYGYPRNTTPNIDRLAARAIRYRNHFAGGSFTTPGTASLLTGVLPWTHRAFDLNGVVAKPYANRNFFSAFQNHYNLAYTHNSWAYTLLRQFGRDIDELIPREKLLIPSANTFITRLFTNDNDAAAVSWERESHLSDDGDAYSLFLSHLVEDLQEKKISGLQPSFPRGLPTSETDIGFTLEQARDYIVSRLISAPQPFAGYFHFLPPHYPYNTSSQFYDYFNEDGFVPIHKPRDVFATNKKVTLQKDRKLYDEFVLYCDDEFGKLYNSLKSSGLLENTWLILTSDHGEMFERDITGHVSNALYQPGVRVPMLIFEPGRTEGMDIHDYTSAIDVLPTLAHVTGETVPEWGEGVILPPFQQMPDRSLYVLRAVDNAKYAPFTVGSFMQVRGGYKLHYYFGYRQTPDEGLVKLYDLQADPEEMNDLAALKPETTAELLHELKTKLKQVDEPYL